MTEHYAGDRYASQAIQRDNSLIRHDSVDPRVMLAPPQAARTIFSWLLIYVFCNKKGMG